MPAKAKAAKSKSSKKGKPSAKDRLASVGAAGRQAAAAIGHAASGVGQAAAGVGKATGDALGQIGRHPALSPELLAELEPEIRRIVREELAAPTTP